MIDVSLIKQQVTLLTSQTELLSPTPRTAPATVLENSHSILPGAQAKSLGGTLDSFSHVLT